jgi:2-dehydro-3-deoxygluconokinase
MSRFVSVGECMIEMSGGDAGSYRLGYAGDTLNTAWYARACLPAEWTVDYVTALGDDLYSQQMVEFFADNGIGTGHIQRLEGKRPGLYLIHQAEGDRHFTYWRGQSAAKLMADAPGALNDALAGADIAYFSGISLAILNARSRGKLLRAIHLARQGGARVAFDPNERPALWTSPRVMGSTIAAAAIVADVVLPTFPDEAALFGDASPGAVAQRYLSWGAEEVVVKNGAEPAYVAWREGRDWVAPKPGAKSVDPTGAGDSFNGAYLAARAQGQAPLDAAAAAHAVAAIVIGQRGALVPHEMLGYQGSSRSG